MKLTSILKKVAMAVTGLALFGFLVTHLAANLMILQGAETFNAYPEQLRKFGVLLYFAEAGLVAFFAIHAFSGIRVAIENRRARATRYTVNKTAGEATFASRSMVIGGVILLIFLIAHVWMFKFGDWTGADGLWGLVIRTFQNPVMVAWYEIAMLALGLHLSHGLASALQTLGANRPNWRPRLRRIGFGVGWLMAIGFAILPIWSYVAR